MVIYIPRGRDWSYKQTLLERVFRYFFLSLSSFSKHKSHYGSGWAREDKETYIPWLVGSVIEVAVPVPAHFAGMNDQLEDMQVAVIRSGLRREEMRFIQNFGTLAPGGLNQDFSLTWLARAHTPLFLRAHFQISKFSATANWHIFPDEGGIA